MYLYFSMYLLKVYKKFNMCFFINHLNKEMAEEKAFILHTSAPSKWLLCISRPAWGPLSSWHLSPHWEACTPPQRPAGSRTSRPGWQQSHRKCTASLRPEVNIWHVILGLHCKCTKSLSSYVTSKPNSSPTQTCQLQPKRVSSCFCKNETNREKNTQQNNLLSRHYL